MRFTKGGFRRAGLAAVLVAVLGGAHGFAAKSKPIEIRILSSRPDLVSGGDALVEVSTAEAAKPDDIVLRLNGKDIATPLKPGSDSRHFTVLVSGLVVGPNTLQSTVKGRGKMASSSIQIRNYPGTGPILSGAHLTPYECRTVESGLGQPLDANCSAKGKIDYFYRASDNTFRPLENPGGARPADLVEQRPNKRALLRMARFSALNLSASQRSNLFQNAGSLFKVNNGTDYGSPRFGMNTFDFIMLTLPKKEKVTSKICFTDENGKQVCQ